MVDVKDFESCAQGSRCYEQLRVIDNMNHSRSCDLRALNAMNNSRLRMTLMILGCELMTLNAMNNIGFGMK